MLGRIGGEPVEYRSNNLAVAIISRGELAHIASHAQHISIGHQRAARQIIVLERDAVGRIAIVNQQEVLAHIQWILNQR